MTRHELEFEQHGRPGHWASVERVLMRAPDELRYQPYMVQYVDSTSSARLEHNGPEIPGPHTFLTLTKYAERTRNMRQVQLGDVVVIFGHEYLVEGWGMKLTLQLLSPELSGVTA